MNFKITVGFKTTTLVLIAAVLLLHGGFMVHTQNNSDDFAQYKKQLKKIESKYKNPWIGKLSTHKIYNVDGLRFVQACEKSRLNEDPVYADIWIMTKTGKVFKGSDICVALKDIKYIPPHEKAALKVSEMILTHIYESPDLIIDDFFNKNENIPEGFYEYIKPPHINADDNYYEVAFYISHPDPPYFMGSVVPLQWNLQLSTVVIQGYNYSVKEGPIIKTIKNMKIQIRELEDILINHFVSQNMLIHMEKFLQKNEVYGLIDPPDPEIVESNRKDLEKAWISGFAHHRDDIVPLYTSLLNWNRDFVLDVEKIINTTGYHKNVNSIENYGNKIRKILDKIRDVCLLVQDTENPTSGTR
jgi:hypothetical protein